MTQLEDALVSRPLALPQSRAERSLLYGVIFPALLVFGGVLSEAFRTEAAFVFGAALISAVGVITFADLLFHRTRLSCGLAAGMGASLGYGLTSVNTWYYTYTSSISFTNFVGEDIPTLCLGLEALGASIALLYFWGEWVESPFTIDVSRLATLPRTKWLTVVLFLIMLGGWIHGDLGYMGQQNLGSGDSVIAELGMFAVAPAFGMTLAVAAYTADKTEKVIFYILLAIEMLMTVPLGRRYFIFAIFIAGIISRSCPIFKRGFVWKRVIAIVISVFIIYLASIVFLYIRIASYTDPPDRIELARRAYQISQTATASQMSANLAENTYQRGFIFGFLADLVEMSSTHGTAAYGRDLYNSLVADIPSIFWKDKARFLPPSEEELASEVFSTNYPDLANSLFTAGAVDFGFLGVLVYPLLAVSAMAIFLRMVAAYTNPTTTLIARLAALYLMIQAETGFSAYTTFIRNTALFILFFGALAMMRPTLRSR